MSGFTTLIEKLSESQFQNIISLSYYIGVKQIVDQLIDEGEDYCSWKLQQFRTGEDTHMFDIVQEYLSNFPEEYGDGEVDEEGQEANDYDNNNTINTHSHNSTSSHNNGPWNNHQTVGFGHEEFIKKHNLPFSTHDSAADEEKKLKLQSLSVEEKRKSPKKGANNEMDETDEEEWEDKYSTRDINEVPSDVIFPKDLYESVIRDGADTAKELSDPEKLKLLGDNLDTEQMDRFELYRRSKLPKTLVRRLVGVVTKQSVHTSTALYLCAIGKLFLGDVVEKALQIKKKCLIAHSLEILHLKKLYGNRILKILKKITKVVENYNNNGTTIKGGKSGSSTSMANSNSVNISLSSKLQFNLANDDLDYLFNEDDIKCDTIFPIEDEELIENNDLEEDDYYENVKDSKQKTLKEMLINLKNLLEDEDMMTVPSTSSTSNSEKSVLNGNQYGRLKSLVIQYNYWLEKFHSLDYNVDKFDNSPLQPEHVREAWRLYREESDILPPSTHRLQGEGTGWLF